MRYGSVCSGIEAATVAWHPLGWEAAWFAEIEPFPSAVLAHHYPDVTNHGDFTRIHEHAEPGSIDVLVGGTPCQSFSVAGLRKGLADPRGNLALEFLRLADAARPGWLVWENVPGVLSSGGGRDLGSFLGALGQLGYGWAYRVLDAQYFGVPQRRRRVFVVGHLGDWRRAAAVLFERHGLSGHPPPRREAGPGVAEAAGNGTSFRSFTQSNDFARESAVGGTLTRSGPSGVKGGLGSETLIADAILASANKGPGHNRDTHIVDHTLRADGFDASEDGAGRGTPLVPVSFDWTQAGKPSETVPTLRVGTGLGIPSSPAVHQGAAVRRLTPVECERLQGFPDHHTAIPWKGKPADQCPDGPRYKALGNSMAVPVMRWIGERIEMVREACR